ncbi:MAG: hypothetical protein HY563_07685, partial [Ignavibacteriales bacterium]|nr:hypothetical protein [Ignavibacteriales bacterium]
MAALVILSAGVSAGERSGSRGIGMARTVNGPARGLAALGVNPANLGMNGYTLVSAELLSFGFRTTSEMISYDLYNEFFTGVAGPNGVREPRYLDEADKQRILSRFPDGTALSSLDLELVSAGVAAYHPSLGGLAVAITDRLGVNAVIPKDFMTILLYGLDPNGSSYAFDRLRASAWWFREFNVSYGTRLPISLPPGTELYGGIGMKFIAGYGFFETERYRAAVANEPVGGGQYVARLDFDYVIRRSGVEMFDPRNSGAFSLFPAPAGKGFGIDVGLAAIIHGIEAHLSVTDIGSISWKRNTVETYSRYRAELTDPFLGTIEDSLQYAVRGRNRAIGEFSAPLPTKLRVGIVLESGASAAPSWIPTNLLIAVDYT